MKMAYEVAEEREIQLETQIGCVHHWYTHIGMETLSSETAAVVVELIDKIGAQAKTLR